MINQREQDWRTPMEIVGSRLMKGNLQLQSVILDKSNFFANKVTFPGLLLLALNRGSG